MRYEKVIAATFLSRPNRFIARVSIDGAEETVHVKNTGRCKELLIPGCRVYLSACGRATRKTKYDLVAVEKAREGTASLLINMDSQIPNAVAEEWLRAGHLFPRGSTVRREVRYGGSRFDFYLQDGARKAYLEVKGVTLEESGVARFPDAPTARGVKHIRELMGCMQEGYEAYILFVIQMKGAHLFCPNDVTHKAFGDVLREAAAAGVTVLAIDCTVLPDGIEPGEAVPVAL